MAAPANGAQANSRRQSWPRLPALPHSAAPLQRRPRRSVPQRRGAAPSARPAQSPSAGRPRPKPAPGEAPAAAPRATGQCAGRRGGPAAAACPAPPPPPAPAVRSSASADLCAWPRPSPPAAAGACPPCCSEPRSRRDEDVCRGPGGGGRQGRRRRAGQHSQPQPRHWVPRKPRGGACWGACSRGRAMPLCARRAAAGAAPACGSCARGSSRVPGPLPCPPRCRPPKRASPLPSPLLPAGAGGLHRAGEAVPGFTGPEAPGGPAAVPHVRRCRCCCPARASAAPAGQRERRDSSARSCWAGWGSRGAVLTSCCTRRRPRPLRAPQVAERQRQQHRRRRADGAHQPHTAAATGPGRRARRCGVWLVAGG